MVTKTKKPVAKKTVVSRAKPFVKTEKKTVVKSHVRVRTAEGVRRQMIKARQAKAVKS